jgi:Na+-translocating ferredoxin:NAD+ oxidoreductase RnfD subunit
MLLGGGVFIARRISKMPLVVTFLGAYFTLFTITVFVTDPLASAEIFRTPDLEAVLYFAFFILTDPPTSPAKVPDQIANGLIVAVVSYLFFEFAGVVYYLLAGVLVGNVWEAWRRTRRPGPASPSARRHRDH